MKHKRVTNKRMKQMLNDITDNDEVNVDQNDDQLLLERKNMSVDDDHQLLNIDSQEK